MKRKNYIHARISGNLFSCAKQRPAYAVKNVCAFTLIELLVVIAIISLLVSILLPSLTRAKDLAKRAVCSSNIHNSIVGCFLYSEDFNGVLPSLAHYNDGVDGSTANLYYWGNVARIPAGKNLNEVMQPYTPGMTTWVCPATSSPAPDHFVSDGAGAKNNRASCYFSFYYVPGREFPNFGQGAGKFIPTMLSQAGTGQVMMQDALRFSTASNTGWNANHGSGGSESSLVDAAGSNPSAATFYNVSENSDLGANIGFYDGSVGWHTWTGLTNLGADKRVGTADFYSMLP